MFIFRGLKPAIIHAYGAFHCTNVAAVITHMYLVGCNKWHPTAQYGIIYYDARRYHISSKYNRHLMIS